MTKPLLLLVDDSHDTALLVRLLCKRAGVELVHRVGVAEGWAALQERTPELLLVDMRLINETGAELVRQLRASDQFGRQPIALFTNSTMHEDLLAGLEAGADLVFVKDLVGQPEAWQERLREILAWARGRAWANLVALNRGSFAVSTTPLEVLARYNQGLRQALGRGVSAKVLRLLLQRAIEDTLGHARRLDEPDAWLPADTLVLPVERIAARVTPETLAFLGVALAEQLWRLLGSRDSAFFPALLEPMLPGLTEALLHR